MDGQTPEIFVPELSERSFSQQLSEGFSRNLKLDVVEFTIADKNVWSIDVFNGARSDAEVSFCNFLL